MEPRLIMMSGPLKGRVVPLADEAVFLGRDPANQVALSDPCVSRKHCLIRKESGGYILVDLDSHNGSLVNGLPVHSRVLEHGDQISIGSSSILFLLDEREGAGLSAAIEIEKDSRTAGPTVELKLEDSLYLRQDKVAAALRRSPEIALDLHTLLKISTEVGSLRELKALGRKLLEFVLELVPADRAAVLLAGPSLEDFDPIMTWDRAQGPEQPVKISGTIARRVLREGAAVLHNDPGQNHVIPAIESIRDSNIVSVICVPLLSFEGLLGLIYVDTVHPAACLNEDHLQLMSGIARIAAGALANARHVAQLSDENRRLRQDQNLRLSLVGESAGMRGVYQFIAKVAGSDATVLVRGETGTGKELVANSIHQNSPRSNRPFVAVNCAALSETLLESDLFGHEKGSFTGAISQKKGKLELANGGTLFLDEVGEFAPPIQAKLLRVLQTHEFERVGGTHPIHVDLRVIAATNRNIEEAIKAGSFRQDLYYRLNVVSVTIPPLRERREDIPLLATYFAAKCCAQAKRRIMGISPRARACLARYDWPGNVRELENAIERAVVLGSGDMIEAADLPEAVLETPPSRSEPAARFHNAIRDLKRQLIIDAVRQSGENYTEAARFLGIHPNHLHRIIRTMNLKPALRK